MASLRWTESAVIPAWIDDRGALDLQALDPAETLAEIPLLGLRLHRGVAWGALRRQATEANLTPLAEAWEARLRALTREGLVHWEGDRVSLTPRGMLVSNGIFEMFV
jgi:oxygen-independent coproporphyrinogen-3 oxidase